jgi:hypothetical protein
MNAKQAEKDLMRYYHYTRQEINDLKADEIDLVSFLDHCNEAKMCAMNDW